jgi:hypothetical protein
MFSKYFSFEELTDSASHKELVPQNRLDAKKYLASGEKLSFLLEEVRDLLGGFAIPVNSGFRNNLLNKAVGSKSSKSKHMLFEAADISPKNLTIQQAFTVLMKARRDGKLKTLRKVLQEGTWLHIEVSTSANDYRGFFISNDDNETFVRIA